MDPSGRAGLHYVVQVILHMLDPSRPEFTASFVGKLLIVIVKKVEQGTRGCAYRGGYGCEGMWCGYVSESV